MSIRLSFRYISAGCLFFLFRVSTLPGTFSAAREKETRLLFKEHKINIGKLDREIRSHLDKIRQTGEREVSVLEELKQIDDKQLFPKTKNSHPAGAIAEPGRTAGLEGTGSTTG